MELDPGNDRHLHIGDDEIVPVDGRRTQSIERFLAVDYFVDYPAPSREVATERKPYCRIVFDEEGAEFPRRCGTGQ